MKYIIRKYLVRDESADIILADCNSDNCLLPVLIKTVLPKSIDDIYDRLCMARELKHQGIQTILDIGTCGKPSNRKHFIASKYTPGITLTQLLQKIACCKKNLPQPLVLHIINNLCEVFEYLHDGRSEDYIPHGNICPDNVFITFDGDVLLIDTGIADLVTHRYDGISIISNQQTSFTHEDVFKGKGWKKRHEIYSLGLLLLCMLIGYNHFMGFCNQDGTHKLDSPSRFFPSIPADLNRIIVRAIGNKSFGYYARYSNIREFSNDLLNFSISQGIGFNKDTTAITIYALFFDSKEIPTQLRYLLQERIIDYCKNGNDKSIKLLLSNCFDNIPELSNREEVIFEVSVTNPINSKASPLVTPITRTDSIQPPQLSIPYDLHLPLPEILGSGLAKETKALKKSSESSLPQNTSESSLHAVNSFSSIILDKSPGLLNTIISESYSKSDHDIFTSDIQQSSTEDISFSAIRTQNKINENKEDHPFSKLLLKEKAHT